MYNCVYVRLYARVVGFAFIILKLSFIYLLIFFRLGEAVGLVLADAKQLRVLSTARNYAGYTLWQPQFNRNVRALVSLLLTLVAALGDNTPQQTHVTVSVRVAAPPPPPT